MIGSNTQLSDGIVAKLRTMVPKGAALHEPVFEGSEWSYVKKCLDTGWVSSAGGFVEKFEGMRSDFTDVSYVAATVTGTAALHTCLLVAGVQPGDEVIVPALTFVATANAVAHCHAIPHFADINPNDLGLNAEKLDKHLSDIATVENGTCVNNRTGRTIRAIIIVHVFGHACDLDALSEVAARHGIVLIEDAAESLGTLYNGKHTGNHGLLSALSFNGNKIVTTGGGGAVMTNDPSLGRRAKHLSTTAKIFHPWRYEHDEVGYNYRLPNINAALGCAQLERIDGIIAKKREVAESYLELFKDFHGATIFSEPQKSRSNYWLNTLLLDPDAVACREELLQKCHSAGFQLRPAWTPLHQLPFFGDCPQMNLELAELLIPRIVNLPSSCNVTEFKRYQSGSES